MQTSLPAPTATGSFAKTPFPHLLIYAVERRLTGTFELTLNDTSVATLVVAGGFPAKVRLSEPIQFLGLVLNELGIINEEQLKASLDSMQETPRLQGQVLLDMGALDAATLDAGLRAQVERKVEHLFGLPGETAYAYFDGFDALQSFGGGPTPIDPFPVLWRGVRSSPSWGHVDATLRRVGTALMKLTANAQTDRIALLPQEAQALDLMKQRPVGIIEVTGILGPNVGQVLVYFLMLLKQVELVDASQMPKPSAVVPPSSGQAFARVQLTRQTARNPPIREEVIAQANDERASSPAQAAASAPPPSVPPAVISAPPPVISAPPPAEAPPPRSPAVFSAPPPPVPASLSPEQLELKAKILERAEQINSQNYFEMLGLDRNALPEAVNKSFIALAKVWHPDRLPPALADVKDACSKVFTHITEAHQTLSDTNRRQDYITLIRDGGATPDDQAKIMVILEAATDFQKADHLLKRNMADLQAYDFVKKAVMADPEQVDYVATLAWLDAQKPENQPRERTMEKIAILDRCILKNRNCERAFFYRGMLLKRVNEIQKAQKDFKMASELNPRNLDAIREVRLYKMRGGASMPPPGTPAGRPSKGAPAPTKKDQGAAGGLFGKLFKK